MELNIYCGDWDAIPLELKRDIMLLGVRHNKMTDEQLFEECNAIALRSIEQPINIFTNNYLVDTSLRLAVKNYHKPEATASSFHEYSRSRFYFYEADGTFTVLNIRKDGKLERWPKGCFSRLIQNLMELG